MCEPNPERAEAAGPGPFPPRLAPSRSCSLAALPPHSSRAGEETLLILPGTRTGRFSSPSIPLCHAGALLGLSPLCSPLFSLSLPASPCSCCQELLAASPGRVERVGVTTVPVHPCSSSLHPTQCSQPGHRYLLVPPAHPSASPAVTAHILGCFWAQACPAGVSALWVGVLHKALHIIPRGEIQRHRCTYPVSTALSLELW